MLSRNPSCDKTLDGFSFDWQETPYTAKLSRISDTARSTKAELTVHYTNGDKRARVLLQRSMNLLENKHALARELHDKQPEAPWANMLEQVSVLALRELRRGEPILELEPTADTYPAFFVLNPLLYKNNPTVLYGPGDSMKSLFALYCALLLASGQCGAGGLAVSPEPWRVLFLDWEMTVEDLRARVKLLRAGDPRLTGTIQYRRCFRPLAHDLEALKKAVNEGGFDVLILDSLAMAAGGVDLEKAECAVTFTAALRELGCTSLIIGHTPKPQEEQPERTVFGSVFFTNLSRSVWEVRREQSMIGLYQRKNNLGPKQEPAGYRLAMDSTSVRIEEANLLDEPALAAGLPVLEQLRHELMQRPGQTVKQLADALGFKRTTVRGKLMANGSRFFCLNDKWECMA